jgi:hypothetical protein
MEMKAAGIDNSFEEFCCKESQVTEQWEQGIVLCCFLKIGGRLALRVEQRREFLERCPCVSK